MKSTMLSRGGQLTNNPMMRSRTEIRTKVINVPTPVSVQAPTPINGSRGPTGLTGDKGPPGLPGSNGLLGPKGDMGAKGDQGAPGVIDDYKFRKLINEECSRSIVIEVDAMEKKMMVLNDELASICNVLTSEIDVIHKSEIETKHDKMLIDKHIETSNSVVEYLTSSMRDFEMQVGAFDSDLTNCNNKSIEQFNSSKSILDELNTVKDKLSNYVTVYKCDMDEIKSAQSEFEQSNSILRIDLKSNHNTLTDLESNHDILANMMGELTNVVKNLEKTTNDKHMSVSEGLNTLNGEIEDVSGEQIKHKQSIDFISKHTDQTIRDILSIKSNVDSLDGTIKDEMCNIHDRMDDMSSRITAADDNLSISTITDMDRLKDSCIQHTDDTILPINTSISRIYNAVENLDDHFNRLNMDGRFHEINDDISIIMTKLMDIGNRDDTVGDFIDSMLPANHGSVMRYGSDGNRSGWSPHGYGQICIGKDTSLTIDSDKSISIGNGAGRYHQSNESCAMGSGAGCTNQGMRSVSIGTSSGNNNQGSYCIALGYSAGLTNQHNNSIIINSSGAPLNSKYPNSLYISQIRSVKNSRELLTLKYDPLTCEIITVHT